jgi:putative aldouronate transport system permease protein
MSGGIDMKKDRGFQAAAHIVMALFSVACLLPFLLLIVASITDESTIARNGYSLFPEKFGFAAYAYLAGHSGEILRSYLITIIVTIIGTAASLMITALLAYPLSRKDLPKRGLFTIIVVFTMLFNGGLTPTYLIYTEYLHIKNTIFALIIPGLLMNAFTVMLMRTYFTTNVPAEIIESSKIDGAGEFKTFFRIVIPVSLPILATVGLLSGLNYWNDWYNGLIYLTEPKLFSLQNLLNRIMTDIQFLSSTNLSTNVQTQNLPSETVRMAMAAIAVVPVLCAYPFLQKYFVKGIALGAVKG